MSKTLLCTITKRYLTISVQSFCVQKFSFFLRFNTDMQNENVDYVNILWCFKAKRTKNSKKYRKSLNSLCAVNNINSDAPQ